MTTVHIERKTFNMDGYIPRQRMADVQQALREFPAVCLIGPRQCGKSTLARQLLASVPGAQLLDLELPSHLAKLRDPEMYFASHATQLVCLDEVQRLPQIFPTLRAILDARGRAGQLLLLGSAAAPLLRQSSESLAGRLAFIELTPLQLHEVMHHGRDAAATWRALLLRGGYPASYLAASVAQSFRWRRQFIRSFIERELPALGIKTPPQMLRRLWQMCAHQHGELLNMSKLAGSLGISNPALRRHLDVLQQTFMLRQLPPYFSNAKKRLTKAPKIYLRDSGFLTALLALPTFDALLGHPSFGHVWEGWVIEHILAQLDEAWEASFYRTKAGAEIDLVLTRGQQRVAIECKAASAPHVSRGFWQSLEDLSIRDAWLIAPVQDDYPIAKNVMVTSLYRFLQTHWPAYLRQAA